MSNVRRMAMIGVGGALALGVVTCAGLAATIALTFDFPPPQRPIAVEGEAPPLPRGKPVTVLVWNVQFAAGRAHEFFYDGGEAVSVTDAEIDATLDGIVAVIQRHDPDILLLQEVDRGSRRTNHVDQHARLAAALDFPTHASTPYFRVPYVPAPGHEHLGAVDMHLSVFSRYGLDRGTRHQLALIDEPWWRQLFNLRRALMEVRVPLDGGGELVLLNTHLSAFSKNDGTLERQIDQIRGVIGGLGGSPWLLAGDFNALPPGDDPGRLPPIDQPLYASGGTPIAVLFDEAVPAVPASELAADPQPWRTYVDFGATTADRTLDYVFYGPGIDQRTYAVDSSAHPWSDHLPLVATVVVE